MMTGWTRRQLLAATAACTVASPALAADTPSIHALARAKNMRFGSCVAWSPRGADAGSFANPDYAALLEKDCGILVPENELKWQRVRPEKHLFDFTRFQP